MFKFYTPAIAKLFHSICIQLIDETGDCEKFVKEVRGIYLTKILEDNDLDGSDFSVTKRDLLTASKIANI